ncbi:MAG: hypothetical protein CFE24_12290 [Flavobacterium sp. BFFFF2]|nr:MAG: hypothetical protein CFE24_12290 [Flavobacterium sp. BFFFF2]
MEEIINKVANSSLAVFDLEDFFPNHAFVTFDLSIALWEGFVLREKDFRDFVQNHDWEPFQNKIVLLDCSTDAIVPAWAYILISVALHQKAFDVFKGNQAHYLEAYYSRKLCQIDYETYRDKPVILKGCSKKPVPEAAYVMAMSELQNVAKSVMYGEACSAVPLFKNRIK